MKRTTWQAVAVLIPFIGVLTYHSGNYLPFLSDDSLISIRYARRLLDGYGLTWTAGPRVEGYSNLLWVLLIALLGRFGVDLIAAARLLGVLGMTAAMFSLSFWYCRRNVLRVTWFPMTVGLLFLALAAPIAVWAIGGLETPLYAALIAASIPLASVVMNRQAADYRRTLSLSLVLGLLCLTRPDGLQLAVAAAFSLLVGGWSSKRARPVTHSALTLLFPLLLAGGQLAFRALYYGDLVPNTARVKVAATAAHRAFGFEYLSSGFAALSPFSFVAVAAILATLMFGRSRGTGIYLSTLAIAWGAFVVFIGGDIFPAYRHLVPLMVLFAFGLAEGAYLVAAHLAARPRYLYSLAILALAAFVPYTRGQVADKWVHRATTERWEWQGKEVGLLLKKAFGRQQPTIAVTAAGCLPYWSELPALDMMGLNDYYLPRHRPASFGTGMVGHELGDGKYVLSQEPDLIIFDVGSPEPAWRSGDELNNLPEFHARYVPVTIRTHPIEYTAVIFVDKYSDRIGIGRSGSAITVPGFFFTGAGTVAALNHSNMLSVRLAGAHTVSLRLDTDADADAGQRWLVDAVASGLDGIDSEVRQDGRSLSVTLRSTRTDAVEIERVVLKSAPAAQTR